MPTFVLIKIANSCVLAAQTRLKEDEGHSKIEKDLVKHYSKLIKFKIFQTQGCGYRLTEEFSLLTDDLYCVLSMI